MSPYLWPALYFTPGVIMCAWSMHALRDQRRRQRAVSRWYVVTDRRCDMAGLVAIVAVLTLILWPLLAAVDVSDRLYDRRHP